MYSALDDKGERVGNPIKASRLGEFAGIKAIEKKMDENREHLKDLPRRKRLGDRIRAVVAQCKSEGAATQSEIERRLEEKGISAVFRVNEDGRLTGATFIDHRNKDVYNGSNLGKDLSANEWHKLFTTPAAPDQETVGSEQEQVKPRPASPEREELTPESQGAGSVEHRQERQDQHQEQEQQKYVDDYHYGGLSIFDRLMTEDQNEEEIDPDFKVLQRRKKKKKRIKR